MTPAERRYLRAHARYALASHDFSRMGGGAYIYAVADEMTAARVEMLAAAQDLLDAGPRSPGEAAIDNGIYAQRSRPATDDLTD